MFKFVPTAALLLGLLLALPAQAAIGDAEAVNRAGMQRMLGQRIARSYLMIGTDTRADLAAQTLDESLARVEENAQRLEQYAASGEVRKRLDAALATWQRYRQQALLQPTRAQSVELLQLAEAFLAQSEALVQAIERQHGNEATRLVDRSGRQRMLSQRIAMLYLAMSWKLEVPELRGDFDAAVAEFEQGLDELNQAPRNTEQITQQLGKIGNQWRFARAGFRLADNARFVPTVIVTTSDSLLRKFEQLTRDYEALARNAP
ncbi:type IV pili methyl-accepting chemotaxis transducer N-terminal domain-containing protein [Pseudomonas sp.]|uniref:type IV pili methyl-accepting chemotaxis transducer N-terminal domain-containing protein n=1 Tax=Pseudomonas sp. TaxID=306 RepID=UPI0028A6D26A|nr:type IV pili methyl-accepting chemotaxis transducer N-terminal domain-containing protein [Pseudomonas sp.]